MYFFFLIDKRNTWDANIHTTYNVHIENPRIVNLLTFAAATDYKKIPNRKNDRRILPCRNILILLPGDE